MLSRLAVAAALLLFPVSAFADSCPIHMKQIDAMMKINKIPASIRSKAKELRAQSEQLHKSGDHAASEALLADIKRMLGG